MKLFIGITVMVLIFAVVEVATWVRTKPAAVKQLAKTLDREQVVMTRTGLSELERRTVRRSRWANASMLPFVGAYGFVVGGTNDGVPVLPAVALLGCSQAAAWIAALAAVVTERHHERKRLRVATLRARDLRSFLMPTDRWLQTICLAGLCVATIICFVLVFAGHQAAFGVAAIGAFGLVAAAIALTVQRSALRTPAAAENGEQLLVHDLTVAALVVGSQRCIVGFVSMVAGVELLNLLYSGQASAHGPAIAATSAVVVAVVAYSAGRKHESLWYFRHHQPVSA